MSSTVQPGEVLLGKYRVERVLGQGGMGIVVAARHVHLGELFAIKMLLPEAMDHHEAVERFLREARASAKLKGEHVARVHDVGSLENGIPYMVLEYLDGQDLKKVVRSRGGLPLDEAALYVYQACEAVSEAHSNGIVHRDLKPANLFLIQRPNGSPCVKVLDFGISKEIDPTNQLSSDLTRTGAFMGSPLYMSPEQMANIKAADVRTDIWALGVILYELVVGRVPFTAAAVTELVTKVLTTSPVAPSEARPGIPTAFDAIVLKCLEKRPEHRFQSVRELMEQLLPYANVVPQPRAPSRVPMASASAPSYNAAPLAMAAPAPIANTFSTTVLMDSPTASTNPSALHPAVPVAPDPVTAGAWGQTNPAAVGKKDKTALIASILAVGVVGLGGVIFAATRLDARSIRDKRKSSHIDDVRRAPGGQGRTTHGRRVRIGAKPRADKRSASRSGCGTEARTNDSDRSRQTCGAQGYLQSDGARDNQTNDDGQTDDEEARHCGFL